MIAQCRVGVAVLILSCAVHLAASAKGKKLTEPKYEGEKDEQGERVLVKRPSCLNKCHTSYCIHTHMQLRKTIALQAGRMAREHLLAQTAPCIRVVLFHPPADPFDLSCLFSCCFSASSNCRKHQSGFVAFSCAHIHRHLLQWTAARYSSERA
jgi:hypothetical protein